MDLSKIESKHVQHWYLKMRECVPTDAAKAITLEQFHKELFVFCIDFAQTPRHMYPAGQEALHLVSSGVIDLKLQFGDFLKENIILYVASFSSLEVKMNATGEVESHTSKE